MVGDSSAVLIYNDDWSYYDPGSLKVSKYLPCLALSNGEYSYGTKFLFNIERFNTPSSKEYCDMGRGMI